MVMAHLLTTVTDEDASCLFSDSKQTHPGFRTPVPWRPWPPGECPLVAAIPRTSATIKPASAATKHAITTRVRLAIWGWVSVVIGSSLGPWAGAVPRALASLSGAAEVFTTNNRPRDSPQDCSQKSARWAVLAVGGRPCAPLLAAAAVLVVAGFWQG